MYRLYKFKVKFDTYKQAEPPHFYLGTPDNEIICPLNSIQVDSVSLEQNFNNTFKLSFDVDKYVKIKELGINVEANGYDLLEEPMKIYIENVGWFMVKPPRESNDGRSEFKSVSAESTEIELTNYDLVGFKANCGTTDSIEMLATDNVEIIDGVEFAKESVKFYNEENPQLSLLDAVLSFAGIEGWSIGYIDPTPKIYHSYVDGKMVENLVQLKDEVGYFDIDNQNAYAFLTQDVAQYFECLILFDFQNMTINAYRPENYGKDTNVVVSFRNFQNSNEITVDENSIYTRYRVSGGEDLDIRSVNFGSDCIENFDYYLNTRFMSSDLIVKYKSWQNYVEQQRIPYIENTRLYSKQLDIVSELSDRVPLDDCSTEWNKFSDAELQKALDNYRAQKAGYESFYVDEEGNFDEEKLKASSDANDYYQIRDVIIPSIEIEMENRKLPTSEGEKEYIDTYKTNWDLYGVDELQINYDFYETRKQQLKEAHYDLPYADYSALSDKNPDGYPLHTRDAHEELHAEYLDVVLQLDDSINGTCAYALKERTTQYDDANALLETYLENMTTIATSVNKETWSIASVEPFTRKELRLLNKLTRTTDYVNNNMFITSSDDQNTAIDEQLKLFDASVKDLEGTSQPQYIYSTSLDNFLAQYAYKLYVDNLELGDFLYLEPRDNEVVKLRFIGCSYNPMKNNNDLSISFSNMVKTSAERIDVSYLLSLTGGTSKNSISGTSNNSSKNEGLEITPSLLQKIIASSQFNNSVVNAINQSFTALVGEYIAVKSLNAEMINVTNIEGENGFFEYLQTKLIAADKIVAGSGEFGTLSTLVAQINALLSGTVSAELGHIIQLTAENVNIDEAVIRDIIAAQITVSMLKAGDITLSDNMRILSENGFMVMNGETLQLIGKNDSGEEYVAIQLGYGATGKPSLIITDENGSILLDGSGLHEGIVPDGLIKDNMIQDGTISKDKLAFNVVETDENGKISAVDVLINNEGLDVKFTSIEQEIIDSATYSVYVEAPNGNIALPEGTLFIAHLYRNSVEVSDNYGDEVFSWERHSLDKDGDSYWNAAHAGIGRNIYIKPSDFSTGASFRCKCESENDGVIAYSE